MPPAYDGRVPSPDDMAYVIARTRTLLLDFDGPVCALYPDRPATEVAAELRDTLAENADALRDAEVEASQTATATAGVDDLIAAVESTGRQLVVVSNTSVEAITAYLRRVGLFDAVRLVVGRYDTMAPDRLLPDNHLIRLALIGTDALPGLSTYVGGSLDGIEAARSAYVASIGYADQAVATDSLIEAGVDAVTSSIAELADTVASVPLRG